MSKEKNICECCGRHKIEDGFRKLCLKCWKNNGRTISKATNIDEKNKVFIKSNSVFIKSNTLYEMPTLNEIQDELY